MFSSIHGDHDRLAWILKRIVWQLFIDPRNYTFQFDYTPAGFYEDNTIYIKHGNMHQFER